MKAINLEWTPVSDAAAYRLTFRESETGNLVTRSEPFSEPRYALDTSLVDGRAVYARLEVRRNGEEKTRTRGRTPAPRHPSRFRRPTRT